MQNELQAIVTKIDILIRNLKEKREWQKYDELEFELYLYAARVYEYEAVYNDKKIALDVDETKEYQKISWAVQKLSEAAKTKLVEVALVDKYREKDNYKANVDKYKNYLYAFSRIADHMKSGFIKDMADAKRQNMVTGDFNW